jgi:hypothetical protein
MMRVPERIYPIETAAELNVVCRRLFSIATGRAAARVGRPSSAEVTMLVTLVAILCNGQLCLEKVVTDSEQSGITMTACQTNGQIGIADWLANGPYHEWKLEGYRCVLGKFIPRHDA